MLLSLRFLLCFIHCACIRLEIGNAELHITKGVGRTLSGKNFFENTFSKMGGQLSV